MALVAFLTRAGRPVVFRTGKKKRETAKRNPMGILDRAALRRRIVNWMVEKRHGQHGGGGWPSRAAVLAEFGELPAYPNFLHSSLMESAQDEDVERTKRMMGRRNPARGTRRK